MTLKKVHLVNNDNGVGLDDNKGYVNDDPSYSEVVDIDNHVQDDFDDIESSDDENANDNDRQKKKRRKKSK